MYYYILLGFLIIIWCYWYFGAKQLNFPGPHHYPFFGALFEFLKNKHRFYDWLYDYAIENLDYGAISYSIPMREPHILLLSAESVKYILNDNINNYHRQPIYEICDELLGDGIFNTDGNNWKHQRKIASHMFSRKELDTTALNIFNETTDKLIDKINNYIKEDKVFDLQNLIFRVTMDSICKFAFDYDVGCIESEDMPEFAKAIDFCTKFLFNRLNNPFWKLCKYINIWHDKEYHKNIKLLDNLCYEIIKKRKNETNDKNDILSLFMKEEDITDKLLRDIVFSFIMAGRDTTASSVSWVFYEMIKDSEIRKKTRTELINTNINNNYIDAQQIKELMFIEHTFLETLRLHPPVPVDVKYSKKEDKLPNGIIIPANTRVIYSPYLFGRLESIWEKHTMFDPDRWNNATKTQYEFIAFNAGPRICLGRDFAKIEAKIIIAKLLNNFEFELVNNKEEAVYMSNEPLYSIGITSAIKDGLIVKAKKINL